MPDKNSPNRFQKAIIKGIGIDRYMDAYEARKKFNFEKGGRLDHERFEETEKLIWYRGNTEDLEWFYKTNVQNFQYQSFPFWRAVNTNIPRVHYGLPRMISNTFGTLLFNHTPEFSIQTGSKVRDKQLETKLHLMNELNDIVTLLQKGARLQSYSGGVAIKLNYDSSISDLPLFTIYPKERYSVKKKYGQLIEIDFKDEFENHRLITTYGRGYIQYKLYKGDRQVPLTDLEETAGLKDVVFVDENQNLINILFATVVDNPGEQSDYESVISSFHALDEVYSGLVNYMRKMKPHIFISEDLRPKDSQGRKLQFNDFDNIITTLDKGGGEINTEITRDTPTIVAGGYLDSMMAIQRSILSKVGLSPATVGLQDGGANSSAEALTIREFMSNRTRDEKLAIWRERLNEFYYAALVFETLTKEAEDLEEGGTFLVRELPDFQVKIDFGEFIQESEESKINKYMKAVESGLMSIEYAVKKIWGDEMSEDEQLLMIQQIKGEPITPE